ncbi:ROK family transcriptional regulator [Rathayibacter tanaceti]|uniref:N-acetylglucosamine repressor n=2 Tax=Rathayibacter tanaceti TaxID=1671680 RepID=A0A162GSH7_9MICO|nr:ROK family transcriptional regulator [Rathayibacter tanaceti]KZX21978.1 N-acetylglucosamine repressor [Rathayibacter tanaceti]QHC56776.1 ROK family protein [Rathayibacter tanaceti]TCO33748.1 putative NBD/HSP70 family sugar kinase [Rathayibacter tanaceti]
MTDAVVAEDASGSSSELLAREVLIHGPLSRSELGRRLGLSPASLTRLARPFLDGGLVVEGAEQSTGVGRPARPLDIRAEALRFAGVKITGTEILAVRTDLRAQTELEIVRALPGTQPSEVVRAIVAVVDELGGASAFAGLGVTLGGSIGADGRVSRAPFLGWRDVDLARPLSSALDLPVALENDVVALTGAEHWFGRGRGIPHFAVLTVGAGVGYGLVVHDRVVAPPSAGLGLGGHYPLDPAGPVCESGHRGCSTAMLSLPSLTRQLYVATGHQMTLAEGFAAARAGDAGAARVLGDSARALGTMIAAIANLSMAGTVILAGEGVALYSEQAGVVEAAIASTRDPDAPALELLVDDGGLVEWARGAAATAIQRLLPRIALGTLP